MTPLMWWQFDPDQDYSRAKEWVQANGQASCVRVGRWEQLLREAHHATGYVEMYAAVDNYLHHSKKRHKERHRWDRPQLTAALLNAIQQSAEINPDEIPAAHQGLLAELRHYKDKRLREAVVEVWKLQRARRFLTAVVQEIKLEASKTEKGDPCSRSRS